MRLIHPAARWRRSACTQASWRPWIQREFKKLWPTDFRRAAAERSIKSVGTCESKPAA